MVRNAIFLKIAVLYVVFSKFSKFLAGQFFYKQNSYKKKLSKESGSAPIYRFYKKKPEQKASTYKSIIKLPTEFLKPNLKFSKFAVIYEA